MKITEIKNKCKRAVMAVSVSLIAFGLTPAVASNHSIACSVVGVTDGDTVTCLTAQQERIRVRLANIDAPESGQDFGQASKRALSDLIFRQEVLLKNHSQDRYGRTIATIERTSDGLNVNLEMVRQGMAWVYEHFLDRREDNAYHAAQRHARSNRAGLWAHPNPVPPWDFRRNPAPAQTSQRPVPPENSVERQLQQIQRDISRQMNRQADNVTRDINRAVGRFFNGMGNR